MTAEWVFARPTTSGELCAYVSAIYIRHPTLEMFIASEYAPESCGFEETRRHEMLHYADLAASLRNSQQRIKSALRHVVLPTSRRPWRLRRDAGRYAIADAQNRVASIVQNAIQPIADDIDAEAVAKGRRRDAPLRLDAVYRKCKSWLEIRDGYVARAPSQ